MDIIIAGAGRVGFRLAGTLSHRHNVTIIDKNAEALLQLQESLDVFTVAGDIDTPATYLLLRQRRYDLFIAVTDSDESNILSVLIAADIITAERKIVRLKNIHFSDSSVVEKVGIDTAVFPFTATAASIAELLEFPLANNVKRLIYSPFLLLSVFAQGIETEGISVAAFNGETCAIVGIEREKRFFLPDTDTLLLQGDLIYLFGHPDTLRTLCTELNTSMPQKINRIAVFGANLLGLEIAKALLKKGVELKIIDKDTDRCRQASELFQEEATVINSHYTERTLLQDHQIGRADMAVFTSSEDEENIIRSLEAKEQGIPRTVAINNDIELYNLMHSLGITAIRGPKSNAYYTILEKIDSSSVISERHYCGGKGGILSRKIFSDSPLAGKAVNPPDPKRHRGFIIRDGILLPWVAKLNLHEEDVLFVFFDSSDEEAVKHWIYAL